MVVPPITPTMVLPMPSTWVGIVLVFFPMGPFLAPYVNATLFGGSGSFGNPTFVYSDVSWNTVFVYDSNNYTSSLAVTDGISSMDPTMEYGHYEFTSEEYCRPL